MNIKSLELSKVTKKYNINKKEIVALNNVNYTFESGKFYAITGHSGSGKSTLISILGLIENDFLGEYKIDNQKIEKISEKKSAEFRNKKIGFIFQNFYLDDHLKAFENMMVPMIINNDIVKDRREEIAKDLLRNLGLEDRLEHYPKELSGGEQQRVAIARALANNPDIILADEPTGNLDEKNEEIIFQELKKMSETGKIVIVVSHSLKIKEYADVTVTLKEGNLV